VGCSKVVVKIGFIKLQYRQSGAKGLDIYRDPVQGWIEKEGELAV